MRTFCKYCGKQVDDDSIYCRNCGEKILYNNGKYDKFIFDNYLLFSRLIPLYYPFNRQEIEKFNEKLFWGGKGIIDVNDYGDQDYWFHGLSSNVKINWDEELVL